MKPLTHGSVLIAGAKASNFNDDIKSHPRVIMWDSQDGSSRWAHKELPQNVQAVFTTKWVGHAEFINLLKEVRKRNIVIFPSAGTGEITRLVKELLDMERGKLQPLKEMIDPTKTVVENSKILFEKAEEMGIKTTLGSVTEMTRRIARGEVKEKKEVKSPDIAIQMIDAMLKELKDLRDYYKVVTDENQQLKTRIDKFKKMLDGDNA